MTNAVEPLLKIIEEKVGWGESKGWQIRDFENLQLLITDVTGVSLSPSTLRRLWGRLPYRHDPSITTLNALAAFAGFENWRDFQKTNQRDRYDTENQTNAVPLTPLPSRGIWLKLAVATIIAIAGGLFFLLAFKKESPVVKPVDYGFSNKMMTHEVPNSVVFTYDAISSPTDSVFIQQEWDPDSRVAVSRTGHVYTSIYYEPAFYHPKLISGSQVVKEQSLLISTKGWLGLIRNKPVPIYLDSADFIKQDMLSVAMPKVQRKTNPTKEIPTVRYYNVGNFEQASVKDFVFNTTIKNNYSEGAAACQFSYIILLTDDIPITIPLAVKGCISDLNLYAADSLVSGKTADLSAFGVDFENWIQVSCRGGAGKIKFFINENLAYESVIPTKDVHIVGIAYAFQGTGAVKYTRLASAGKILFQAF